jgi:hypothetical protein
MYNGDRCRIGQKNNQIGQILVNNSESSYIKDKSRRKNDSQLIK